jgi:hypothetical protein
MMIPPGEVDASESAGSIITLSPSGVRFNATEMILLSGRREFGFANSAE